MLFRLESCVTLSPVVVALILATIRASASTTDIEAMLRHGAVAEALSAAGDEARTHPKDVEAQELYVDLLVATGQQARAEKECRARVAAVPLDPVSHYLLGRAVADGASAQAAYEAALKLDPEFPRAYMGLAAVHESRNRLKEAADAYARAVIGDPSLSEAWLGRIRMALRTSRAADALTIARQGLAAVPDEPGLVLAVAELAPPEARTVLAAGLKVVPDEPRLHEALGGVRLAAGDAAGALQSAEAALAIDPSSVLAGRTALYAREILAGRLDLAGRTSLEAVRAQEGIDRKAAVARYPALIAKYPKSALVRLASGSARRASGDPAGIDDLVQAVMLDPQNIEVLGAAGLALLSVERATEAEPLLAAAAPARPWDASLGLGWVRALLLVGRPTDALQVSGQLAAQFPMDAGVQVTLGGMLVDAGKNEDAYRVVKAALLRTPDPRLAAAFVRIAPLVGHPDEAAALLDQIVAQTGNPALAEAARKLRESTP